MDPAAARVMMRQAQNATLTRQVHDAPHTLVPAAVSSSAVSARARKPQQPKQQPAVHERTSPPTDAGASSSPASPPQPARLLRPSPLPSKPSGQMTSHSQLAALLGEAHEEAAAPNDGSRSLPSSGRPSPKPLAATSRKGRMTNIASMPELPRAPYPRVQTPHPARQPPPLPYRMRCTRDAHEMHTPTHAPRLRLAERHAACCCAQLRPLYEPVYLSPISRDVSNLGDSPGHGQAWDSPGLPGPEAVAQ